MKKTLLWLLISQWWLIACSPPPATLPPPVAPERSPTATFASTATATARPLPTLTATEDIAQLRSPLGVRGTSTPAITLTPTLTPIVPPANPDDLRKPPAEFDTTSHFLFGRPVLQGNNSPVSYYRFGMTGDGRLVPHHGVDIANDAGVPVVAIGTALVYYAGPDVETVFSYKPDFYGNTVVLQMYDSWNGYTVYALYGHLQEITVQAGETVAEGQQIGLVGSTGVAYGPHLHFEIRLNVPESYWVVRNPELWYRPIPGYGVLAGRVLDAQGRFIPAQPLSVTCSDERTRQITTYWDQGTPPDPWLVENLVMGDLPRGTCTVETIIAGRKVSQTVEIRGDELTGVILR